MQLRKITITLFILLTAACSRRDNAPDSIVVPSTIPPAVAATPQPAEMIPDEAPSEAVSGSIESLPDGGARVSTSDGLVLSLGSNGQIVALTLNGEALPITPSLPVVARDLTAAAPAAPNLLANPGFENGDAGWSPLLHKDTTVEIAADNNHTGTSSLAIRGNDSSSGAVISDPVAVSPGTRYRISGHFRSDFGYVTAANNPIFWQDRLYTDTRSITGLYLQWLDAAGAPLFEQPQFAAHLHWNAQDWHQISREVTAPSGAAAVQIVAGARPFAGTIWIDDLAWIESPEPDQFLTGALEIHEDYVVQRGEAAGLQTAVIYRPVSDHIAITVSVTDPSGGPRALDVAWGLPLALDHGATWRWWDGLRESRPVLPNMETARTVSADITGYLPVSLYPYTLLEDGERGLSLAIPLESPRYVWLGYDGWNGRYEGRAHLGISPLAEKLDGRADFTLLLYQTDPTWGLRAAAEKHAAIGPDWYDTPGSMSDFTDFAQGHFGASGKPAEELAGYNETAVYAAQYTVFELNANMESGDTPRPSYAEALDYMNGLAAENSLKATYPASVVCDSAGEPHLKGINVYPWSNNKWSAIWIANVDPDIPDSYGAEMLNQLDNLFTDTGQAGLTLNGVQIDNFLSVTTVDTCPEHIATADLPLTYNPNSYQPGVHVASAGWEYLTALRALLDSQPPPYRGISVNFWGLNIPTLLSPYLDGFGGEGKVKSDSSNWNPPILDYRQATAMGRLRLFANQESDLTLDDIETFAHEAIYYGVWSSRGAHATVWPAGAEEMLAWANAQVKPLAQLGWQPIPYAATDHPDVWVERFGNEAFTAHNWGDAPADFTLTIDLSATGLSSTELTVYESINGRDVVPTLSGDGAMQINFRLEPGRSAVFWMRR